MSARDDILRDVRDALRRSGHSGPGAVTAIPREYRHTGRAAGSREVVEEFSQRLHDYGAEVSTATGNAQLLQAISAALSELESVVIPGDAPLDWIRTAMARHLVYLDSRQEPLPHDVLDRVSAVLTGSRCAVASIGAIVLDGVDGQGRRAISLIPDTHVVVVDTSMIVETVPEAFDILGRNPTRPITWVAGPSATSDIELTRVEGVHGPRHLKVILFTAGESE